MFREYCNYKEYFIEYACTTHPHNTYIQFLVETGIFGFIFIISTFIFLNYLFLKQIIYKFINRNFLTDTTLLFLGCIYINLWPLTPTGNFFNNWLSIIYYMPVGFVLFFIKKEKYK